MAQELRAQGTGRSELGLWGTSPEAFTIASGSSVGLSWGPADSSPHPSALFGKVALCSFCSIVLPLNFLLSLNVQLYTPLVSPFVTQAAPACLSPGTI